MHNRNDPVYRCTYTDTLLFTSKGVSEMQHCEEVGPGIFVRTVEVQWHYAAPTDVDADKLGMQGRIEGITCIDYHPIESRFLTTGGDSNIIIWAMERDNMTNWLKNAAASDMSRCCRWISTLACNDIPRCARWSPQGRMIASAHSERIRLWWKTADVDGDAALSDSSGATEIWKDLRRLTAGQDNEVMDLAFSPDSRYLISAVMRGAVLVHDIETLATVFSNDVVPKFCYGVAWDPWNIYVAAFGSTLVVHTVVPRSGARNLTLAAQKKSQAAYHGEGYSSSMRRLNWSPDGSLLATPFGKPAHDEVSIDGPEWKNRVYMYLRGSFERPIASITVQSSNEIRGVLWAPCFLQRSSDSNEETSAEVWSTSQYRMALAVWSEDTVYVYTTDQHGRHSDFTDLHMLSIADLTWSRDAQFILTCSFDGYVTAIFFDRPLGKAFVIPSFSESALCRGICTVASTLAAASEAYEAQQTKVNPAANSTAIHTAVKKKKRRTEDQEHPVTSAIIKESAPVRTEEQQDIALDELLAFVDNEE